MTRNEADALLERAKGRIAKAFTAWKEAPKHEREEAAKHLRMTLFDVRTTTVRSVEDAGHSAASLTALLAFTHGQVGK